MRGRWGAAGEAKSSGQVECAQKVRTGLNLSVVIADKSGLENPSNLSTNTFATHNAVKWTAWRRCAFHCPNSPPRVSKEKRPGRAAGPLLLERLTGRVAELPRST